MFFSKLVKRKFGDRMEKWNTQVILENLDERRHRHTISFTVFVDDNCPTSKGFCLCVGTSAK